MNPILLFVVIAPLACSWLAVKFSVKHQLIITMAGVLIAVFAGTLVPFINQG